MCLNLLRAFFVLSASVCGLSFAMAYFPHGTLLLCPYFATQVADGCLGAPLANTLTVQHKDFYAGYAQQSGQVWPTTVGNTGVGNPGLSSPHPFYNVAGVDYSVGANPVSIGGGYTRNTDPSSPGYGLKLMTSANFILDGMTSGCSFTAVSGRLSCLGVMPNNPSHCPTTTEGNNCVIFDGYDFTNHATVGSTANDGVWFSLNTSLTTSKIIIKNSYLAPSTLSYSQTTPFTISTLVPVTIANNKIDGFSDLASLRAGVSWYGNNPNANSIFSFSAAALQFTDNADCGAYAIAICIQYNAIIHAPSRIFVFSGSSCTASCDGFVSQFNYQEFGSNVQAQITGYIDDGLGAGGAYDGNAGNCLTVTSTDYGRAINTTNAGGGGWNILSGYKNGSNPGLNSASTVYVMSKTPCNSNFPTTSFTLSASSLIGIPPSTMYPTIGIHGDPYFVGFTAPNAGQTFPIVMGMWRNQYNVNLFPANSWSSTAMSTFNTTNGTYLKKATLDNCTPSCGAGASGYTLNIPDTASYSAVSSVTLPSSAQTPIVIGQTIPSGVTTGRVSPFPAGGVTIVGSAANGAMCDNGACTGTGTTGTYLVSYSGAPVTVSYNNSSGIEMTALTIDSFTESHNVYIANLSPALNANGLGPQASVIGDNHAININTLDIDTNYYDPIGGVNCISPFYNNSPSLTINSNVNLLGNRLGAWDPNSNSQNCNLVSQ